MTKTAAAPASLLQSLRLLSWLACASLAQPLAAMAQANAPLPPVAQEALNKGIIATKVPDYLLAIRYFEAARKAASEAPVVYLNLGLAESRIPGREVRALAWFGAYLTAYPDAPNAAAVKEQVDVLVVRNQSNVSRFLRTVQAAASQVLDYKKDYNLGDVAELWAKADDVGTALKTADVLQNGLARVYAYSAIAIAQANNGDLAGAQKTFTSAHRTADLLRNESVSPQKNQAQLAIAKAQTKIGDIAGAQKTLSSALQNAGLLDDAGTQSVVQGDIAKAQLEGGDVAGAQSAAGRMKHPFFKTNAQLDIARAQIKAGDGAGAKNTLAAAQKAAALIRDDANSQDLMFSLIFNLQMGLGDFEGAKKTADLVPDAASKRSMQTSLDRTPKDIVTLPSPPRQSPSSAQPPSRPVLTVSDWLKKLDDDNKSNDCPLNTEPFLDLAGYLKSLPPSGDPQMAFQSFHQTAKKLVGAQNVVNEMLKQQAGKW